MQIYANTPPPPTVSSPQRTIAGFWRRLLAFALDTLITSLPCFLLGLVFYSVLSVSTVYGGFIGFVFTVAYFGIFNSSAAQGQSLGQRMMKIQVVNRSGEPISLERSVLRGLILLTPLLLSSQALPAATPYPVRSAAGWLILAAEVALLYFYIFNTRTRQSLHDLATGTYVVDVQTQGTVKSLRCWKGHWAILASLAVAGGLATVIRDAPFPELSQIQRAVLDSGKAKSVTASVQKTWSGGEARTGLLVSVIWSGKRSKAEQDATEIADIVLRTDSHAADRDFIRDLSTGLRSRFRQIFQQPTSKPMIPRLGSRKRRSSGSVEEAGLRRRAPKAAVCAQARVTS